jgi:cell division protein FtsZ
MNTIREFMAEEALVIVGTVIDESMAARLRVTMVATGLGPAGAKQQLRTPSITLVEPVQVVQRTGTDNVGMPAETVNYDDLEQPAVVRRGRTPSAGAAPAFDATEIPAFLRKQAD